MGMPSYAPPYATPLTCAPTATITRSRGSSVANRYVPDGYPLRESEPTDYLKPGFSHPQPTPPTEELQLYTPPSPDQHVYTPPVPEQYETPRPHPGVPAAQQELSPYYPDVIPSRRASDAHHDRSPHGVYRHGSVASSHRSQNSHRSYHSARSRRSNTVGQIHLDMEHDRQQRERARSVQHESAPRNSHESRSPPASQQQRKRSRASSHGLPYREPHRAFGSSIFSFFGGIKGALKK